MIKLKQAAQRAAGFLLALAVFYPPAGHAQKVPLPDAPPSHLLIRAEAAEMPPQPQAGGQQQAAQPPAASPQATAPQSDASEQTQAPVTPSGPNLTLADAERMAIQHNPNISVARLLALAQAQVTREARSSELPTATGNLTAVDAHENTRITAGLLNNSTVFNRAAAGLTVSQLITDFGRTHNLVKSAQSSAKAQLENERATEQDITLTVDQAFYQALTAQTVLKVAEQTLAQRQAT